MHFYSLHLPIEVSIPLLAEYATALIREDVEGWKD